MYGAIHPRRRSSNRKRNSGSVVGITTCERSDSELLMPADHLSLHARVLRAAESPILSHSQLINTSMFSTFQHLDLC